MSIYIQIINIKKNFKAISGRDTIALNDVSFEINKNEFLAVLGPSGAGKSTLLYLLSRIESPSGGNINFVDSPKNPRIGFVFQTNTIFPWRNVERNLTYALELKRISREQRKKKAIELCNMVILEPNIFLTKYPKELSGGEMRRVAIGMALSNEAELFLLDEPTTQLDYITKWSIQNTIQDLWLKREFTTVLVTHDIEEAIYLGDRIIILENGKIKAIVKIKLARPREDCLRNTDQFNIYREEIYKYYNEIKPNKRENLRPIR